MTEKICAILPNQYNFQEHLKSLAWCTKHTCPLDGDCLHLAKIFLFLALGPVSQTCSVWPRLLVLKNTPVRSLQQPPYPLLLRHLNTYGWESFGTSLFDSILGVTIKKKRENVWKKKRELMWIASRLNRDSNVNRFFPPPVITPLTNVVLPSWGDRKSVV